MINATGTGCETLKNLILPFIGSFTILDSAKVTERDLGRNFFVEKESVGKSRAKVCQELLNELNPNVVGKSDDRSLKQVLDSDADWLKQFDTIIATEVREDELLALGKLAYANHSSLVVVESVGFFGYCRIVNPEHLVLDTKPDQVPTDLRIANPFPELVQYANSIDMAKLDDREFGHTPFPIILLQQLDIWRKAHEGKAPTNYKEKQEFKSQLRNAARNPDHQNFIEAINIVNTALTTEKIPSSTRALLNDPKINVDGKSDVFWFMMAAVKKFTENEGNGSLPLLGSIPDVTATTQGYLSFQKLYSDRANKDVESCRKYVDELLTANGRKPEEISAEEFKTFVKNSLFHNVIRYRSLEQEQTSPNQVVGDLAEDQPANISAYITLRAYKRFEKENGRVAGSDDSKIEQDEVALIKIANQIGKECGATTEIQPEIPKEIVRAGGAELHSIAAVMGGVAAQEIIKLRVRKFTPMNNTFVYNGVNSTSCRIEV